MTHIADARTDFRFFPREPMSSGAFRDGAMSYATGSTTEKLWLLAEKLTVPTPELHKESAAYSGFQQHFWRTTGKWAAKASVQVCLFVLMMMPFLCSFFN
jgi:hypothetical protein